MSPPDEQARGIFRARRVLTEEVAPDTTPAVGTEAAMDTPEEPDQEMEDIVSNQGVHLWTCSLV